ncbi:MAG: marine proteobacterial sortase target protein [Gammaproteobacteria bacterium]|nr:marine proteobacterial sortase target protein [Gammaproteobacteria bacterium]
MKSRNTNRLLKNISYFVISLLLCCLLTPVYANEMTLAEVKAGHLLFQTNQRHHYQPALLLKTKMDFKVSGLVALVKVQQHFKNTSEQWVEGRYVFPLPEDSAVNKMRIKIGDRLIEGEIKEKQEAKAIYQKAKINGQKASLVEQERPNMFTNSIAHIAPGDEIIVEIQYLQTIHYDQNKFSLRFPMTITPRYIPGKVLRSQLGEQTLTMNQGNGWAMNTDQVPDAQRITPPMISVPQDSIQEESPMVNPIEITGSIDMAMPLKKLISSFHPIDINQNKHQYTLVLSTKEVTMDRDFILEWSPILGQEPQAALFSESKKHTIETNDNNIEPNNTTGQEPMLQEDNHIMLMMMPPKLLPLEEHLPKEMIYIIDTSGSMGGTSIRQARESLSFALNRLSENDRFNIIEFNSQTNKLFSQSVKADKNNILYAQQQVSELKAGGGTEMASALMAALENIKLDGYLRQVVFITDGSVGNETQLFAIIHEHLREARLFTIGIGSAPNSYFMRKSAQFGRGTFTYIASVNEVQQKMSDLFKKLESPVLSHLKIIWPQGSDVYPKRIPDLYMGEPLLVTAQVPELKGEVIIEGQTQQGVWRRKIELTHGKQHEGISTLWARSKIGSLMDEQIQGAPKDLIKPQVIDLALRHQLMSKYTSFIAVDKTPIHTKDRRIKESLLKKVDVRNLVPKGQNFSYPKTATPAMLNILIGLLLLTMTIVINRRRLYENN